MSRDGLQKSEILSTHQFTRPSIRFWLPVLMAAMIMLCGWIAAPRIRVTEFIAILFLIYVAISSMVSICEISVVEEGLIIDRLMLPAKYVPWSAIDRVVVFALEKGNDGVQLEIATVGLYEGLSPLNRLPGPMYGQGFRQTIVLTPDTIIEYDALLAQLDRHCTVVRRQSSGSR